MARPKTRRSSKTVRRRDPATAPVLLVLCLCALALAPAIFLGRVPAQTDWLRLYGPWGKRPWRVETAPPFNQGGGDNFFVYVPDRLAALNEWKAGRVPLWNPYISGGVPFLGMQTADPVDPLIVLELLLPEGHALGLAYAVLLFAAGAGLVLYVRDRGVTSPAALTVAGVAFALNPYLTVWLENRVFLAGLAGLPLALWAMERLVEGTGPPGRAGAVLAAAIGYSALGGTLQTFALLLLVLVVRLAWRLLRARRGQTSTIGGSVPWLALAITVGLALGSLPLAAGIELLTHSTRLGPEGYYTGANFLHWRAMGMWFHPGLFGFPNGGQSATLEAVGRWFMSGSGFGYQGIIVLGLAALAVVRRAGPAGDRWFWAGLGGATVGFLLLQATPVHGYLLGLLPWMGDVDLPRGLIVTNLAGAILAGWGAQELEGLWSRGGRTSWLGPWIGFLVVGAVAIVTCRAGFGVRTAWLDLVPVTAAVAAVIGMGMIRRWPARSRMFAVAGLVALELGWFHFAINTFSPQDLTFPPDQAASAMAAKLNTPRRSRFTVEGRFRVFPPNTASVYGLTDVRGYTNIPVARFRALLECAEGRIDLRNLPELENLESPIYRMLGVEYLFLFESPSDPQIERVRNSLLHRRKDSLGRAFLVHQAVQVAGEEEMRTRLSDPEFDPARVAYLETGEGPLPDLAAPRGEESVGVTRFFPNRVTIRAQATAPGLLVLSDAWFPGWRATVDGKQEEIRRVNWGLRGVAVAAGNHEVEFRYRPPWLAPGIGVTGLGLLLVALGLCVRPRRARGDV